MPTFNLDKNHAIIAVYLLYTNERLAYIGRSSNLRNRLSSHFNPNNSSYLEWKKQITKIEYYKCQSVVDSDILETYLINVLKPIYNVDKVFTDSVSFKLELPEKFELVIGESLLEKLNNKLGEEGILTKLDMVSVGKLLAEGKCTLEDVKSRYPLLVEGYEKLGINTLKALGFNSFRINNALSAFNNSELIKTEVKKIFVQGFYLPGDAKVILQNIYDNLGLIKRAKAQEIESILDVKMTSKRVNGKPVKGYFIREEEHSD